MMRLVMRVTGQDYIPPGYTADWTSPDHGARATALVTSALDFIPDDRRQDLLAYYVEGKKLLEIASTREKARTRLAKGIMRLRRFLLGHMEELRGCIQFTPIPGGPYDPAWLTVAEAEQITRLSPAHLRHLTYTQVVPCRRHPADGRLIQLDRESLRSYVLGQAYFKGRKRRGVWRES